MTVSWRDAEAKVVRWFGGRATPGSGNQKVRGDVRVLSGSSEILRIEVKFTKNLDYITMEDSWLKTLEAISRNQGIDVALGLFNPTEELFYEFEGPTASRYHCKWSTRRIHFLEPPDVVVSNREDLGPLGRWALRSFRQLKQNYVGV